LVSQEASDVIIFPPVFLYLFFFFFYCSNGWGKDFSLWNLYPKRDLSLDCRGHFFSIISIISRAGAGGFLDHGTAGIFFTTNGGNPLKNEEKILYILDL